MTRKHCNHRICELIRVNVRCRGASLEMSWSQYLNILYKAKPNGGWSCHGETDYVGWVGRATVYCSANAKCSIFLLVKSEDTAFCFCTAVKTILLWSLHVCLSSGYCHTGQQDSSITYRLMIDWTLSTCIIVNLDDRHIGRPIKFEPKGL